MKRLCIFFILLVTFFNVSKAQTDRQFWFVAPAITASHAGETPIYFRVTAGSLGANISISMPANLANFATQYHVVPANTTLTINVSAFVSEIENNYDVLGGVIGKSNKGIYIESDNPVTVYYEDGMTNNCDIFALKGRNGLGTEFYTVFQNKGYNMSTAGWAEPATSTIDIVATVDGTVVTIESPLASQDLYNYRTGNFVVNLNKGQTFSIPPYWNTNVPTGSGLPTCTLTKYANDLFGRAGADHLGGLHITSNANHPIAITKKDDSVRYYCVDGWGGGCYDLIGDQMVPLDILGKEYIAMRGGLTTAPENVYCVATADNTSIYINGNIVPVTTINRGQTYVYELWNSVNNSVHIRGSEKLSVLHVSGFVCEVGGAILPPIDKCTGSTKVSVNRTTAESFFFNIMVWSGAESGFYINGILQNVDGGDPANGVLFGPNDFQAVPGTTNWKIWRSNALPTNLPPLGSFPAGGTFSFENTMDVFHLGLINGGGASGCRFGYFSDFNELKVDAQATGSLSSSIRACSYERIQLYAQGGTDYNWWPIEYLDDPTSSTPISNPPADTIMLFLVEVSGACGLTDTATVSVEKFPELECQFSIDQGFGCSPLELTLHEVSTQVRERFWDFNFTNINGSVDRDTIVYGASANIDTDTIFVHTFVNTSNEPLDTIQNYLIRLLAKNTNDCSDTSWASVNVYPEVTADFSISVAADTIGCSPHFIQYVNNSNNEDAYVWRFGDGVSNFTANPSHIYYNILNSDTVYTAQLVARSDLFCRDTAYMIFTLHPYIENGFTINKHEGCSPLEVTYTNGSVFADTVFLDYGDGNDTVMTSFTTVLHRYSNLSTTVDTNVVEMVVKNDEGCYEYAYDTIIVYPQFVADYDIDGPDNYVGCNSRDVIFTNTTTTSAHAASIFLWTFGDGSNSNTTAVNVPHTYTNNTINDKTYTFNLRAESQYGCWDDTIHNLAINRAYSDFVVDNDEGCSPLPVTLANTSIGTGITTWLWSFGDGTANDANPIPATNPHVYNNTTGVTQNRYLRLTVTGTNGCSTFKQDTIDVYSSINLTFTPAADQIGCDSLVIPFNSTIVPNIAGTTYQWSFGDGTSSSADDITHVYRNFTGANVIYPASLLAQTLNGCTDSESRNITVRPYVNAVFTVDKVTACSPMSVDPYATSYPGIATYRWNFGDATAIEIGQNPLAHSYPVNNSGANKPYTLQLEVSDLSGLCTDIATKSITVYSEANADFNPKNTTACNPYNVTFDNLSFNAATYKWDFKDGTTSAAFEPSHSFFNTVSSTTTKTYNVELEVTSNMGCTDIFNSNVSVYRYVEANFDINVSEGCSPLTVNITNNSKGGIYHWYWNSVDGSGLQNSTTNTTGVTFPHIYTNNSGNVQTVYLTCIALNAAGCSDTLTRPIVVQSAMNAQFVSLSVYENCAPFTVNFDNQTAPASDALYFTWDFGDGTSGISTKALPDISHTFTNNTDADITRTVTLTAESAYGCPNSTTRVIKIYRRVIADFELNTNEDCSPVEIEITNKSKGGTYQWSWDNPPLAVNLTTTDATANPILHSYTNTSQIDIIRNLTVVATNGHAACNKTLSKAIKVHSSVVADFAISDAANCNPLTSTFSPTVSADADKFYWYYSDGTAEISSKASAPVTHVFNNAGTNDKPFQIEMRAETVNGCKNSISKSVQVYSYLDANFAMESSSGCPPFSTTIENTSFGNAANTYKWYVNGVEESSSIGLLPFTHTYDNTNPTKLPYNILLHAENVHACVSEYTGTITVAEDVEAIFSMTSDGCSPLGVAFTNSSIAPLGTLYFWDFKDGSTSTLINPTTHIFYNPSRETDKTFNVELSIITPSYCTDNTSALVTVYHQPLAQFFIDKTSSCPPLISNMDMNESLGEDLFQWRFGDGNFNTTNVNIVNYEYQNTLGNAVQNYKLELWVGTNEGCNDSSSLILNVYPEVMADYTYDVAGCSPFVSQFNNTSQNANYYAWNFDDGNASNQKNPTNRFDNIWDADRIYQVYLKASSEYNCWDTITKPVTVYVQPVAEFDVSPPVQKFPENRIFIDNLTEPKFGPWNYLWEFGDLNASNSTEAEPQYFDYEHWGEKLIKLSITSKTSVCNDNISKSITILPPDVNAEFITDINGGCLNDGLEVQFTASQSAYDEEYDYMWEFGDGTEVAYSRIASHTYEAAGIYYVKLTATSREGASEDYEYKTIRVYSNPVANFEVSPKLAMLDKVSLEARIEYFNLSICNDTSGCAYLWNFGDGNTSIASNVTHNYSPDPADVPIKYDISLLVTTSHGCSDSLILLKEVEIIGAGDIAFPNAFTPNGDGLNDTFRPVSEGVIKYQLLVYNRWGELIFTTKDLSVGWNGMINGIYAKPDVYVWKAEGKFTNGRSFELVGDVTLIR